LTIQSKKAEIKITLNLAYPIIIGQLGIMLMGVADTIQVGHMIGPAKESIGAAGIANGVYITIAIIGIIALQIIAPMIANASALNDKVKCHALFQASIKVAIILGLASFLLMELVAFNINILHQKPEIEVLAMPYLHILAVSVFPMFIFTAIKQFGDGLGETKVAMRITVAALLFNILFNHLLINGIIFPKLGLNGAGIATLLSRFGMALGLYIYIRNLSFFKSYFNANISAENSDGLVMKILKVGIPSGFQGFFEIAVFAASAIIIGQLGAVQLAAHQVAINPASVTYMMVTGISAAGGIRVGTNLGDIKAMKRSGSVAILLGFSFMILCCIIMLIFNKFIAGLYINDLEVLPLAASLIMIAGFFQLSDGVQAVALGVLRGMADVNIPTIVTLIAYWGIGLPIGYYLAFVIKMDAIGIWIGLSAGLTASAILLTWRFYHNLKVIKLKENNK
jgi:multidrug resistance protein, MATE family